MIEKLAIVVLTALFGLPLTPISFSLTKVHDSWQLFLNMDGSADTGYGPGGQDVLVRTVESAYLMRNTTTELTREAYLRAPYGGWGPEIVACPVNLPQTVTVYLPIGGPVLWQAVAYKDGAIVQVQQGTIIGDAFDAADDAAAAWCVTGPGVPTWRGCEAFDRDRDGDVDLADWARTTASTEF